MPSNEYMREYVLRRYYRRRREVVEKLGGRCAVCGSTDDLEIDHIDATKKSFSLAKALAGMAKERLDLEVAKCQLLCFTHHVEKSIVESGKKSARGTHGTLSSFRYCKCALCKEAKNSYNKSRKGR